MQTLILNRRTALLGAVSVLGGCSTLNALNAATEPLNTYDLLPVTGSKKGGRTSRTLLIARPQASAALATDRIMIRPDSASIAYLPDARWSDELPLVFQSLLIRSISATDRIAYVGRSDAGPVPDKALLVRMDAFEVNALADDTFEVHVDIELTIINDRDQRVVATRSFSQSQSTPSEDARAVVSAFQDVLNNLIPTLSEWVIQRV